MSMKIFTGLQDFLGIYDSPSSPTPIEEQPQTPLVSAELPPLIVTNTATSPCSLPSSTLLTDSNSTESTNITSRDNSIKFKTKSNLDDADAVEKIRHCSHNRSVHFPDIIVTDFYEAPKNVFIEKKNNDVSAIGIGYLNACKRLMVEPIQAVQQQISCFHHVLGVRQECLSLKGHRLSPSDLECLEEIFSKVQFDMLDFEYTFLNDDSAVCLGEMLEFYDSALKLNLSFNNHINLRGWQAICKAIKDVYFHSPYLFCSAPSIQYLDLRYTSLSDRSFPVLSRALRSQSSLTVLHLENVSLAGKNLILIGCALKENTTLRELYLGENNLQPADGAHIYQLIITSVSLQLLDLRNNQLQDGGLRHICDALKHRSTIESSSLSALVLWNNKITHNGMELMAHALNENNKLETLNIGSNKLSLEGIAALKPALQRNCTLQRLGLQATNLNCQCAIVLAECLADNKVMVRLDLRDNPQIGSAGLLALHLAMKMNTSMTLLNLDTTAARSSSSKIQEYQEQFMVYYDEIKMFCERNKEIALKKLSANANVLEDNTVSEKPNVEGFNNEYEGESVKEDSTRKEDWDGKPEVFEQNSISAKNNAVWLLNRSSSLTCAETIDDIPERVAQMSHSLSLIEEVPESVTTIKRNSDGSHHPVLFVKHELSKCPSLPLISVSNHQEGVTSSTGSKISKRFTVSTSSLNATNPRDVSRVKSRFKVERISTAIQKATKAKSDECIPSQLSLNESSADKRQESEFLIGDSAIKKKVEDLVAKESNKKHGSSTIIGQDSRNHEAGSDAVSGTNSGELLTNERIGLADVSLNCEVETRNSENQSFADTEVEGKEICCDIRIENKSSEQVMVVKDYFNVGQNDSFCGNIHSSSAVTVQRELRPSECHKAVAKAKVSERFELDLGIKKLPVSSEKCLIRLEQEANNSESSAVIKPVILLDTILENQKSETEVVVREVLRDIVNYVVYEMGGDGLSDFQNVSYVSTIVSSPLCSPFTSRSLVSTSRNFTHDQESDEDVIRGITRSLVREVLLHEKKTLRLNLEKKRASLFVTPTVNVSNS
ncbi:unnamed protein product [Thelazia callipaeda]|uniref:Protein phosphatase 1 regulatory subunit 37 n=1 Tax=Thelazia callipaeda TaxID=103827 RepID=A0A158RCQ4_THECL|nr:unnamed protein product [Thelazia callipaeda]